MIISASRRTDIPAFYGVWFMNRIRAGYCVVVNPFNPRQITRISLRPEDVDVIVFWTKNAAPFLRYLDELDERGFAYYFLYTLTPYENAIEGNVPPVSQRIETFRRLAERIGTSRVVWRYDPILIGERHSFAWHEERFARLAGQLAGATERVIVSFVDFYQKTERNLAEIPERFVKNPEQEPEFAPFVRRLAEIAAEHRFEIQSCAEKRDLQVFGIRKGKCIDDDLIRRALGRDVPSKKDPHQRKECGCVVSKDIGAYNTCLYACRYCYATFDYATAKRQHAHHDPDSPSLIGRFDAPPDTTLFDSPR